MLIPCIEQAHIESKHALPTVHVSEKATRRAVLRPDSATLGTIGEVFGSSRARWGSEGGQQGGRDGERKKWKEISR